MEQHPVLMHLQQLAAMQVDSTTGFHQISERVKHSQLQDFFKKCSLDSQRMLDDLNAAIIRHNGDTKNRGTLKGALNHLLMKLKADLVAADLPDLLKNIEFCEEFNMARYSQVLGDNIPEKEREILEQHVAILRLRLELLKNFKYH
jgi:uncharacterized protein (TIGR02284 family)